MDEWYYELRGEAEGPVRAAVVRQLFDEGTLSRESLVWKKGMSDWQPLEQTVLFDEPDTPPPITGTAVPNTWVWWLAFAPAIGFFVEGVVGSMVGADLGSLWYITFSLNIGLSYADEQGLRRAGHDTRAMGAAWIVPVYLYKRAKVLRQSKAYLGFLW